MEMTPLPMAKLTKKTESRRTRWRTTKMTWERTRTRTARVMKMTMRRTTLMRPPGRGRLRTTKMTTRTKWKPRNRRQISSLQRPPLSGGCYHQETASFLANLQHLSPPF